MEDKSNNFQFWGLSVATINHVKSVIERKIHDHEVAIVCYKNLIKDMDDESSKYAQFQEENKK